MLRGARRTAATHRRSEHVPNIYTFYVTYRGVHRFVHESSAVSAPVPSGRCGPWRQVVVQREGRSCARHPPEVHTRDSFPFALAGWAPGVGWIGKRANRSQRSAPVPPIPGELMSPEHGSQIPLALTKPHGFGKCWVGRALGRAF